MTILPKLEGTHDAMRLIFSNVRPNVGRAISQKMIQSESGAEYSRILMYGPIVDDPALAEWVGGISPTDFAEALDASGNNPILLRINSPGGSAFGGRAIQNLMDSHGTHITAMVDGMAASAAIFPVIGADTVYMGDGSRLMIHRAWTLALGDSKEMRKIADLLDSLDVETASSIAMRTGQNVNQVFDQIDAETWISAEDAIDQGYADGMISEAPELETDSAQQKIRWNLSAYKHPPQELTGERPAPPADFLAPPEVFERKAEPDETEKPAPEPPGAKNGEVPDYVRRQFAMLDIEI